MPSSQNNHEGRLLHYNVHRVQGQDKLRTKQAIRSYITFSARTPTQFVESEKGDDDRF